MRLDRFITLNLVQPWRRAFRTLNPQPSTLNPKRAVPILMYHGITVTPEPSVSPYYRLNTSPAIFRQHMAFLKEQGYQTISLDQLVSASQLFSFSACSKKPVVQTLRPPPSSPPVLWHSTAPSPRLVCITFDDGFRDSYTDAFPVLQQHAFTATVFLPTAFIGDERRQFRPAAGGRPSVLRPPSSDCLTWSQVRELRRHGIHFGSHTVNHRRLVELDWPDIARELLDSKTELENQLQAAVTAFCYPYAFPQTDRQFVHRFTGLLSETGYSSCATTELGRVQPGTDPFRLKRLPANTLDDLALFAAKLDGAYDWLAAPQSAVKTMKAFLRPRSSGKNPVPAAGAPPTPARVARSVEQ